MLNNFRASVHPWTIQKLGRDWLEYIASNTMNVVTERLDPFIWSYDCKAKILEIRQETPDTKTFVLLPNQHFKQPLPGQHIELTIDAKNTEEALSRCYSLSEINGDTVSITVKHNPEGKVSSWLHDNAKVGMLLNISSPRGRFVYRDQKKLLFICAGAGITPCFSILKALDDKPNRPDIAFYYRSRTPNETIFKNQLDQIKSGEGVDISYSRHTEEGTSYLPNQLLEAYPDLKDRDIYLCGPEAFKNDVFEYLESVEYDMDKLEIEHFVRIDSGIEQARKFDEDVTVFLKSRNISFVIDAKDCGKTLLEAAEEKGIHLEHGCRSGMCGTCRTNLVSGQVSGNQLGKSIYPCTAYPASAQVVLE